MKLERLIEKILEFSPKDNYCSQNQYHARARLFKMSIAGFELYNLLGSSMFSGDLQEINKGKILNTYY